MLQHVQSIKTHPVLHQFAVGKAANLDLRPHRLLPGRREIKQLPLLRSMHPPAPHHLVPFADQVLNGDMQIGEGCTEHGEEVFEPIETRRKSRQVFNVIGGKNLVCYGEVAIVEYLIFVHLLRESRLERRFPLRCHEGEMATHLRLERAIGDPCPC